MRQNKTAVSVALVLIAGLTIASAGAWSVCRNGAGYLPAGTEEDIIPIVDITALEILAPPSSLVPGDTVSPVAVVKNLSSTTGASNVPVVFRISTVYNVVQVIPELLPGETDTIIFNKWTATEGDFGLQAIVNFSGDPDLSNDTAYGNCIVHGPILSGWHEVASIPLGTRPVKRGAWMAIDTTGMIYATKGYKTYEFYCYNPVKDSWKRLAYVPKDENGCDPAVQPARCRAGELERL